MLMKLSKAGVCNMKINKVLGITSVIMGTAVFCAWVHNEARWEQAQRELWETYRNKKDEPNGINPVDTLLNDSLKLESCVEKSYFEGIQAVQNTNKNNKK